MLYGAVPPVAVPVNVPVVPPLHKTGVIVDVADKDTG